MKIYLTSVFSAFVLLPCLAQVSVTITLKTPGGSPHAGTLVTATPRGGGSALMATTDRSGKATLQLPAGATFAIKAANKAEPWTLKMPPRNGGSMDVGYSYEASYSTLAQKFAYTTADREQWERMMALLPDTSRPKSLRPYAPNKFFTSVTIALHGLTEQPLAGESFCITGRNTHKNFTATTGPDGKAYLLLPKGDTLDLHFKYDRSYEELFFQQADAEQSASFSFTYMGTKAVEIRKKEEADRIAAEKVRLRKAEEEFKRYCKKEGISAIEGRRRELERALKQQGPSLVSTIFNRNSHWTDKLIVTDLTGSMTPYASELQLWYKLNYKREQNLQFVFFNDGNNMPDDLKQIGSTGGIYYSPSKGIDTLLHRMALVAAMGSGGDVAENNMEALINGVNMARNPYKHIIMIADNNAPVKDISLLQQFHHPVHVILCGVSDRVEPDYLLIAYKTGGSVHTMEEDILKLAQMLDGQEVTINRRTYRLIKGRFVLLDKS